MSANSVWIFNAIGQVLLQSSKFLCSPYIHFLSLVEHKHCLADVVFFPSSTCTDSSIPALKKLSYPLCFSLLPTDDIPVHASITSSGSMELLSSLREHEDSTATGRKTVLSNVLSNRPSFQKLSSTEKEELKAQLNDDMRKMKCLFGSLVTQTRDSVEKRVSVERLAGSILALGAFEPAVGERDQRLLDEHREEITSAKSVSKIFIILSPYWNYLDFEILVYIISHYGTHGDDSDKKRLQNYEKALKRFCERRIFELPLSKSGNGTDNKKQEKLYVKLNIREDAQAEQMFLIKRKVAEILQLNSATLQIYSVDEGCVQLIFLIPKFLAREIFPLSDEQATALSKDLAVMRLECVDYVFKV